MDIYTRYNLPPPPPPTIFSRDDSVNRARLPNFTSVDQVSAFIDNAIVWRHSAPVDRFFVFTLVFILVLVLSLLGFILHKIAKRSWWVIRVARREHSIRLVPNVHSCWSLVMGSFGLLTVGFFGVTHEATKVNEPVKYIALWMTLSWVPMAAAVWYQTWGIFATWQDDSERAMIALPAWVPPFLVDLFYICLPGIPSIAAMVPGILANRFYEQARLDWYTWQTNFAGQADLSREMVLAAQKIFTSSLKGSYYQTVALVIWFIACSSNVTTYGIASLGLVSDLCQLVARHTDSPVVVSPPRQPNITLQTVGSCDFSGESSTPYMRTTQALSISNDTEQSVGQLFSMAEVEDDRIKTFFPPIAPSLTVKELKRSHARKVLFWFALQSGSLLPGRRVESEVRAYIIFSVIMILFGLSTGISITHATFEASFDALTTARRNMRRTAFRA
ncbi:hypothetical protein V8E36_000846 [Tilletia maclaganii]